jgi:hypothetical protein
MNLFKQQGAGAGFSGRAAGGHLVQRACQAAQQRHLVEQQVVHVAPSTQQRPRARLPSQTQREREADQAESCASGPACDMPPWSMRGRSG